MPAPRVKIIMYKIPPRQDLQRCIFTDKNSLNFYDSLEETELLNKLAENCPSPGTLQWNPQASTCAPQTVGGEMHNYQWGALSKAQIRCGHHDMGHESSSQRKKQHQELLGQEAPLLLPLRRSHCSKPCDSHLFPFSLFQMRFFHCSNCGLT